MSGQTMLNARIHVRRAPLPYQAAAAVGGPLAFLTAWELFVRLAEVPRFIAPSPSASIGTLAQQIDFLAGELAVTLFTAALGLLVGSSIGLLAGLAMAQSRELEETLFPLAVALKLVPYLAIAPLLIVWLGHGLAPGVVIASLSTYFPVLVNSITGLRAVDPAAHEFFISVGASKREILRHLRWPTSLPYLFAALKVAVTLCVLGAIVAEYFGAQRGMGNVIVVASLDLDMRLLFAATLLLSFTGVVLTLAANVVERIVLYWHESSRVEG